VRIRSNHWINRQRDMVNGVQSCELHLTVPDWFFQLESGKKKFEYRKNFPSDKVTAYFYVSTPVKAITGIANFDLRQSLSEWPEKYSDRSSEVLSRIEDFLSDCRYAMPVLSFQPTSRIPLNTLRADLPNFIVPRMYYYIDETPLLQYLQRNLMHNSSEIRNSFVEILDEDIC